MIEKGQESYKNRAIWAFLFEYLIVKSAEVTNITSTWQGKTKP